MKRATWVLLSVAALFFFPVIICAQDYQPSVGQAGKDVIWVPTPEDLVSAMLDLAKVTPKDFLMDLGSGDGRIVIAAAKRGVHSEGIEYNPDMVQLSKRNAEKAGVSDKANFLNADLFTVDLGKATVITMYLLPDLNRRLRPAILNLKPGTRVVSNSFRMDDWDWDDSAEREGRTAYLWIVPAKVAGSWTWQSNPGTAELTVVQKFQKITGMLKDGGKDLPLNNAKLQGSQISFGAGDREYSGQVDGKTIEGTIKSNGREERWSATLR